MKITNNNLPKSKKDLKEIAQVSDREGLFFDTGLFRKYLTARARILAGDVSYEEEFKEWITYLNTNHHRNFKPVDKYRRSFRARRKEGFTVSDLKHSADKAYNDEYHINSDRKYLTPSFLLRVDIIERYINLTPTVKIVKFNAKSSFEYYRPIYRLKSTPTRHRVRACGSRDIDALS